MRSAFWRGRPFSILDVNLYVDAELVTTYSCDGLIVATPIGSTAHSLSSGGPILRKDLQAFVFLPISPHTLTNRPVVDSAERVFELSVAQPHEGTAVVVDGCELCGLEAGRSGARGTCGTEVQIGRSARPKLLSHVAGKARLGRPVAVGRQALKAVVAAV